MQKSEHDTMENYIMKRIAIAEKKKKEAQDTLLLQYYSGQINALYMILTGHNNPLANPIPTE